jgi:hypothetical protein
MNRPPCVLDVILLPHPLSVSTIKMRPPSISTQIIPFPFHYHQLPTPIFPAIPNSNPSTILQNAVVSQTTQSCISLSHSPTSFPPPLLPSKNPQTNSTSPHLFINHPLDFQPQTLTNPPILPQQPSLLLAHKLLTRNRPHTGQKLQFAP